MNQPMRAQPHPARAALGWLKENLFGTWYNTLLTLGGSALAYYLGRSFLLWALRHADWSVVSSNLTLLMMGTYPRVHAWRLWVVILLIAALSGISLAPVTARYRRTFPLLGAACFAILLIPAASFVKLWLLSSFVVHALMLLLSRHSPRLRRIAAILWFLAPAWVLLLVRGLPPWLPVVPSSNWGGLLLTLILAASSIVVSFPAGVLLALGRQSKLPVVSLICTGYIEFVRGVPLISVLFMAQVMAPIFLPQIQLDRVLRAMLGFTLFTSAYMAENVRGGLQTVGRGQYEAAYALGLSTPLAFALIILPQALRAVIPSTVGQFISLLKDTSLVAVVSLLDVMGIASSVLANPSWLGRDTELLLFVAMVYWTFSYSLAFASRRLERKLGVGER